MDHRFRPLRQAIIRSGWLTLALACITQATVLHVPQDVPGIQQALQQTQDGDTVLVDRGTWSGDLVVPDRNLLLASRHLLTGDTTDVLETILQGSGQGPVVEAFTMGTRVFRMRGFTVQGGMGSAQDPYKGGGVSLSPHSSSRLSWLRVRECDSDGLGAAILRRGSWGSVDLDRITIEGCGEGAPAEEEAIHLIAHEGRITLSRIGHAPGLAGGAVLRAIADTVVWENSLLEGIEHHAPGDWQAQYYGISLFSLSAIAELSIRNIGFRGVRMECGTLLSASCSEDARMEDLRFENCRITGPASPFNYARVARLDGDPLVVEDLLLEGNRQAFSSSMLSVYGGANPSSRLSGFTLRNNTVGYPDTVHVEEDLEAFDGSLAYVRTARIEQGLIEGNHVILPLDPRVAEGFAVDGPTLTFSGNSSTNHVLNLEFNHNRVLDPDPAGPGRRGNRGMQLWISGYYSYTTRMRGCLFTSFVSELALDPPPPEDEPQHSVFYHSNSALELEDCAFVDNVPGTIELETRGGVVQNVIVGNPQGPGILSESTYEELLFRNVLVQGARSRPSPGGNSLQSAWILKGNREYRLEHCSLLACDSEVLFTLPYSTSGSAVFNSCVVAMNQYQQLEYDWPSGATPVYEYCFLPEERSGAGNLVGEDPGFVPGNLARWMRDTSPCIDAGDPARHDRDNDLLPGRQPLAPSAGGMRCDMGHLGGPGARPVPCIGAAHAPVELRIRALPDRLRLTWDELVESPDGCPVEVAGYRILVSNRPDGAFETLALTQSNTWDIPLPPVGTRRFFRVLTLLENE